ncbi:beta-1,3-galactosyltransferase 1-like isoform X2 [Tigriopus californicus]|uniref:beta-1,3-galactosyltransferase 1-like isoform X2 n=1 Tax=Tigriopus californicus TaxID=6832 RepID=UPI0027DA95AD|nr:beta-1,3-galactosyltransferase 1-like isoform X2 [Tigriopus californicus]
MAQKGVLIFVVGVIVCLTYLGIHQFQNIPRNKSNPQQWPKINIDPSTIFLGNAIGSHHLKPEWALIGTDPRAYKGPIVKGWPPGKSRDMHQIMVKDYVIEQCSNQNLSGVKLFIGVKTVANRFEARDTTRETWASFQHNHPDVKVMFFSGEVEDLQLLNHLKLEIQAHCDLVIVHGLDTYQNVTMKTVSILSYIYDQQLGLNPEVSMIMDDDSYLNLQRLHHLISHRLLARPFDNALTGFVFGGTLMRPPADSTKEFTDPSVCPTYMYKGDLFPPFLSGSGYILPQAVIPCLYEQTRRLPFLHIDDVFVTGFCAEACGFMRVAHSQF